MALDLFTNDHHTSSSSFVKHFSLRRSEAQCLVSLLFALLCGSISPSLASAEDIRFAPRAAVLTNDRTETFGSAAPKKVSARLRLRGIGRCRLEFNIRSEAPPTIVGNGGNDTQSATHHLKLYTGTAQCPHGEEPASMIIEGNTAHIDFSTRIGRYSAFPRSISLRANVRTQTITRRSIRPLRNFQSACATLGIAAAHSDEGDTGGGGTNNANIDLTVTSPAIDLALVADQSFLQRHRRNAAFELVATANAASALYERDLGIPIRLRAIVLLNSPRAAGQDFHTANIRTLLASVGRYSNRLLQPLQVDAVQLVSGNDLYEVMGNRRDFRVAGLAYVGSACEHPTVAVSVIQDAPRAVRRILMAHEVGHNLAAVHQEANGFPTTGVMAPFVSAANDFFSQASVQQILQFASSTGQCIFEEPTPAPESARLIFRPRDRARGAYVARLLSETGERLDGHVVKLVRVRAQGKVSLIRAKPIGHRGQVRFRILDSGRYQVQVFSDPEPLRSRVIRRRAR